MKASWLFVVGLLIFVAVFSVQNAEPIPVRFLGWETIVSAALVIQLAALLGGLVGLTVGAWSRRAARRSAEIETELPAPKPPEPTDQTPESPEAR